MLGLDYIVIFLIGMAAGSFLTTEIIFDNVELF